MRASARTRSECSCAASNSTLHQTARVAHSRLVNVTVRRVVSREHQPAFVGCYCLGEREEEPRYLNAKGQGHSWAVPGFLHQLRLQ